MIFFTLDVSNDWYFLTTYHPHLVHVFFERPPMQSTFVMDVVHWEIKESELGYLKWIDWESIEDFIIFLFEVKNVRKLKDSSVYSL